MKKIPQIIFNDDSADDQKFPFCEDKLYLNYYYKPSSNAPFKCVSTISVRSCLCIYKGHKHEPCKRRRYSKLALS